MNLLREYLDDQQREDLDRYKCFDVIGSDQQRYRIFLRSQLPVMGIDQPGSRNLLCIHVEDTLSSWSPVGGWWEPIPTADAALSFLLTLKANAPQVLHHGNWHHWQDPLTPYRPRHQTRKPFFVAIRDRVYQSMRRRRNERRNRRDCY